MILDEIVEKKKIRLAEAKKKISLSEMILLSETDAGKHERKESFYQALKKDGLSIIGEFKNASPSLGSISQKIDLTERIHQYNHSVDAISCLTEEDYFHGNIDYFKSIRKITLLPMIRKDFIIDEYQIYEAKVIGADAILLIAAILPEKTLKDYYELAHRLGLDVLTEVHDEAEMEMALRANVDIIGINNRNLKDFSITLETAKRLSKMVPKDKVLISESGVMGTEDIKFLAGCSHVNGLLIGRAFMEAEDPEKLALSWKKAFQDEKN